MILIIGAAVSTWSCSDAIHGTEYTEMDNQPSSDPEDYDRGMREEEAAPKEEDPLVDEKPDEKIQAE